MHANLSQLIDYLESFRRAHPKYTGTMEFYWRDGQVVDVKSEHRHKFLNPTDAKERKDRIGA